MNKRGAPWLAIIIVAFVVLFAALIYLAFSLDDSQLSPGDSDTHTECVDNLCIVVDGPGQDECPSGGSFCGCLDTDATPDVPGGTNYFLQGTTRNVEESRSDHCFPTTSRLIEYVCKEDKSIFELEMTCESLGDFVCFNGACVRSAEPLLDCIDSDGGLRYQVFASARNSTAVIEDYCLEDGRLGETFCQLGNPEILIDVVSCSALGNYICELGACVYAG